MTTDQAFEKLSKKFPNKQIYVQAMRWMHDGKIDDHYQFSVCVYRVFGDGDTDNAQGDSIKSLAEAVDRAIGATRPPKATAAEAEQMFQPELLKVNEL